MRSESQFLSIVSASGLQGLLGQCVQGSVVLISAGITNHLRHELLELVFEIVGETTFVHLGDEGIHLRWRFITLAKEFEHE